MNIFAIFHIKDRMIALIKGLPETPIKVGDFLHQGDRSWQLVGIDFPRHPRPKDEVGLILRGEGIPKLDAIEYRG